MKVDLHPRLEAEGRAAGDGILGRAAFRSPFLSWTRPHQWAHVFAAGRRLELRTHMIEDAIGRGQVRFDVLRGEERSTYEFGPTAEDAG